MPLAGWRTHCGSERDPHHGCRRIRRWSSIPTRQTPEGHAHR